MHTDFQTDSTKRITHCRASSTTNTKDTINNNEVKCPSGGIYSAGEESGRERLYVQSTAAVKQAVGATPDLQETSSRALTYLVVTDTRR